MFTQKQPPSLPTRECSGSWWWSPSCQDCQEAWALGSVARGAVLHSGPPSPRAGAATGPVGSHGHPCGSRGHGLSHLRWPCSHSVPGVARQARCLAAAATVSCEFSLALHSRGAPHAGRVPVVRAPHPRLGGSVVPS